MSPLAMIAGRMLRQERSIADPDAPLCVHALVYPRVAVRTPIGGGKRTMWPRPYLPRTIEYFGEPRVRHAATAVGYTRGGANVNPADRPADRSAMAKPFRWTYTGKPLAGAGGVINESVSSARPY
jgi:hypothetical protein